MFICIYLFVFIHTPEIVSGLHPQKWLASPAFNQEAIHTPDMATLSEYFTHVDFWSLLQGLLMSKL